MSTTTMASAISTPSYLASSSLRRPISSLYTSIYSNPQTPNFRISALISQVGLTPFSSWSGLRHFGIPIAQQHSVKLERKGKCKGKGVFASLFGVGAPEALVIGVVALLVFGPKGLAEVARNLGKTLRAFQPTIRELQVVSREFKSTLEKEIGLDDLQNPLQDNYRSNTTNPTSSSSPVVDSVDSQMKSNPTNPTSSPSPVIDSMDSQTKVDPNGSASPKNAYTTEELLKITEEQLKASAAQRPPQFPSELQTESQDTVQEAAAVTPPPQKPEGENET